MRQADELFAFVSDPEQVVQCLPGASVEGRDGDDWRGAMSMKVGPIKAQLPRARCASSSSTPTRAAR